MQALRESCINEGTGNPLMLACIASIGCDYGTMFYVYEALFMVQYSTVHLGPSKYFLISSQSVLILGKAHGSMTACH